MESVYLLIGKDRFLVKNHIKSLLSHEDIKNFDHLFYDAEETGVQDVLQELRTVSLFDEGKVVILEHLESFDKASQNDLDSFIKYLKKPVEQAVFIMTIKDLSSVQNLQDVLEKYAFIEYIPSLEDADFLNLIETMFKNDGFSLEEGVIEHLLNLTGKQDLFLIEQEIEKLKTYKFDEKMISKKDVEALVSKSFDDNIYDLSEALIHKEVNRMLDVFYDLVSKNIDVLTVLNHLVYKMQEIKYTQLLIKQGMGRDEIMSYFNISSSGRVYYMMKNAKLIAGDRIESFIKKIAQLDYEIKSGKIDKKIGVELLLLGGI